MSAHRQDSRKGELETRGYRAIPSHRTALFRVESRLSSHVIRRTGRNSISVISPAPWAEPVESSRGAGSRDRTIRHEIDIGTSLVSCVVWVGTPVRREETIRRLRQADSNQIMAVKVSLTLVNN